MARNYDSKPYFTGVEDVTIKQGADFSLADGINAYDAYGDEIEYSYRPTSIPKCEVGEYTVTYRAFGAVSRLIPQFCMPRDAVGFPSICPIGESVTAERIIRIIQASDPRVIGIPRVTIQKNTNFDPMSGVSGVDDNGNETEVLYRGEYLLEASGAIASFETDVDKPAESVKVTLEPKQDGTPSPDNICPISGYDEVETSVVGKNLLEIVGATKTIGGITYTVNSDGTVTADGTASGWSGVYKNIGRTKLKAGKSYILSSIGGTSGTYYVDVWNGSTKVATTEYRKQTDAFTPTEDMEATVDIAVYYNKTVTNATMQPMIRLASDTDASYEPYQGSTYTTTLVQNIWDEEWEVGYINSSGAETTDRNRIRSKYIPIIGENSYYIKFDSYTSWFNLCYYDENKAFVSNVTPTGSTAQTAPQGAHYMRFALNDNYGNTYNNDIRIYYAPMPDGKVYGGTLDVVSGELTVDRAMVDLGSLNYTYYTNATRNDFFVAVTDAITPVAGGDVNAICSSYERKSFVSMTNECFCVSDASLSAGAKYFLVRDTRFTSASDFKTAVTGQQLVYELATPQTYQLTPTQVNLLLGQNNVWSDGEITTVRYWHSIPKGEMQFPIEGEYEITYDTTDQCGNATTVTRTIVVE